MSQGATLNRTLTLNRPQTMSRPLTMNRPQTMSRKWPFSNIIADIHCGGVRALLYGESGRDYESPPDFELPPDFEYIIAAINLIR